MSLTLRPLAAGDLAALADLWVAAWTPVLPRIDFSARRDWLLARLATAGTQVLVAWRDAAIVGFVTIDPASGVLDQIAVAPSAQGSGVGRALIEAAKERSPGGVRLDVNEDNPHAIAVYERAGFVTTGHGVSPASGLATRAMAWRP